MELNEETKATLITMAQTIANRKNCSVVVLVFDIKTPENCAYDIITLSEYKSGMYSELIPIATISPTTIQTTIQTQKA